MTHRLVTSNLDCRTYWGTHGCCLPRGHTTDHVCRCASDEYDDETINVGAAPYYGPDTRFYGEDAPA